MKNLNGIKPILNKKSAKGDTMGVSYCEILEKDNSNKVTELKKELQRLTMKIIDEDYEDEEEGKNEKRNESENRVILDIIKRK